MTKSLEQDHAEKHLCPDCGIAPGFLHEHGCDVEPCPECGLQALSCGCEIQDASRRIAWTGLWPGSAECREYGWFAKRAGVGWIPCSADDPEAVEDLNRLREDAVWNPEKQRWEKRES